MKLVIKNRFLFYAVLDENKKTLCKIKNKHFWGTAKEIISPTGEIVYTTDIINVDPPRESWNRAEYRKYVAYYGMDKSNTAIISSLSYARNDVRTIGQRFLFKLPQVDELKVQSAYGELIINLIKYNKLEIRDKSKRIGTIGNLLTFKCHTISCDTIEDEAFLAAIYVLSLYMIHENDLIVV